MTLRYVLVPGYTDSGPQHWQSHWEHALSPVRRVHQDDWEHPQADAWVARLEETIGPDAREAVLIAHSLGVTTVALWAQRTGRIPHGAFLVAPPDPSRPELPEACRTFGPMPAERLRFPSLVVASTDDPYASIAWAGDLSAGWGARLVEVQNGGHLNTASGHGAWPEGRALLSGWLAEPRPAR